MADDMRKAIGLIEELNKAVLGKGLSNEGASQDAPPPNYVRPEADPNLCKQALERLSRHLIMEIQSLIKEDSRFAQVFNIDVESA